MLFRGVNSRSDAIDQFTQGTHEMNYLRSSWRRLVPVAMVAGIIMFAAISNAVLATG